MFNFVGVRCSSRVDSKEWTFEQYDKRNGAGNGRSFERNCTPKLRKSNVDHALMNFITYSRNGIENPFFSSKDYVYVVLLDSLFVQLYKFIGLVLLTKYMLFSGLIFFFFYRISRSSIISIIAIDWYTLWANLKSVFLSR